MTPDPRWLEILKASGWQLLALALAFGGLLVLDARALIPPLADLAKQVVALAFLVTAGLSLAAGMAGLLRAFPPIPWINHWRELSRDRRRTRQYIPRMTDAERAIIAYLLAKNQASFTGALDGGNAVTLISRRIILRAVLPGHSYDPENVPYIIPDHVWKVLAANRALFPSTPELESGPHPWRVHWMLR